MDAFNSLPCHCRSPGNLNTPPQSHSQSKSIWPEMAGNHGKLNLFLSVRAQQLKWAILGYADCLKPQIQSFPSICSRVTGDTSQVLSVQAASCTLSTKISAITQVLPSQKGERVSPAWHTQHCDPVGLPTCLPLSPGTSPQPTRNHFVQDFLKAPGTGVGPLQQNHT